MWPFRRREGDSTSNLGPDQRRSLRGGPPNDWASLPPIQRTIQAAPLVVGTRSFEAILASWKGPAVALEPLGHNVTLEAPSGIITGIAAPVAARDPGPGEPGAEPGIQRAWAPRPSPVSTMAGPLAHPVEAAAQSLVHQDEVPVGPAATISEPAGALTHAPRPDVPRLTLEAVALDRAVERSPDLTR